jgi:parallel beta-helix repeat protein
MYIRIHHNTITDVMTDGISLYPGTGTGNTVTHCTVEYNVITNNIPDDTHTMLAVGWGGNAGDCSARCTDNTIRYNTIVSNAGACKKEYLSIRGDNNQIVGNVIKGAYKAGINTLYADGNVIQGNTVNGASSTNAEWGYCISLHSSDRNTISGNTFTTPCIAFVLLDSGSDSNKVQDNHFQGSPSSNVLNYGAGNTITGND